MKSNRSIVIYISLTFIVSFQVAESQLFDRLFSHNSKREANYETRDWSPERQSDSAPQGPTIPRDSQGVSIPGIYDMIKQGSNLGINVLSGLVKVERGGEAERSGLVGARPLSVRVFGIPVYERGTRVRDVPGSTNPIFTGLFPTISGNPGRPGDEPSSPDVPAQDEPNDEP